MSATVYSFASSVSKPEQGPNDCLSQMHPEHRIKSANVKRISHDKRQRGMKLESLQDHFDEVS